MFYSLHDGNTPDEAFFVEPVSGEISMQRPLSYIDTPTSTYTLTVRATDVGEDGGREGWIDGLVLIVDRRVVIDFK